MLRALRRLVTSGLLLALASCGGAEYELVLHFPDEAAWERAGRVDLVVAAGTECAVLTGAGLDAEVDRVARAEFDAHQPPPALGELRYGPLSFFALVRDTDCIAFLSGCTEEEVRSREPARVVIGLEEREEAGCDDGHRCERGRCLTAEAGTSDAAAIDGASPDAAADAGAADVQRPDTTQPDLFGRDLAGVDLNRPDVAGPDSAASDSWVGDTAFDAYQPPLPCDGPADCVDGNPCTDDLCVGQVCDNPPISGSCDDGVPCTDLDSCVEGNCVGTPIDTRCSDGDVCTDNWCDVALGCQQAYNTAPCDDGVDCTDSDICGGGACGGTPNDGLCSDADPCTLTWCDAALDCQAGTISACERSGDGCCPAGCSEVDDVDCVPFVAVTVTSGPEGETVETSPTFGFVGVTRSGSGTIDYECRVDADAWAPCGSGGSGAALAWTVAATLADGAHTFEVRGSDVDLHVSDPAQRAFTVAAIAHIHAFVGHENSWVSLALTSLDLPQMTVGMARYDSSAGGIYLDGFYDCHDISCSSYDRSRDLSTGRGHSLRIGSDGVPRFSYLTNYQVYYCTVRGGVPSCERAFSGSTYGDESAMVLLGDDTPVIFFFKQDFNCSPNTCYRLFSARWTPDAGTGCGSSTPNFTCTEHSMENTVYPPVGGMAADYLASDAGPRLAYVYRGTVKLLECSDPGCAAPVEPVDLVGGGDAIPRSVAYLRRPGTEHLAYASSCGTGTCQISYGYRDDGQGWQTGFVFGTGIAGFAFAVGEDNLPRFAFALGSGSAINYRNCQERTCSVLGTQREIGPTSYFEGHVDMKLRSNNAPTIVWTGAAGTSRGLHIGTCRDEHCAP